MKINVGDYVRTKDGNIYNILDDEFDIRFRFDTGINYPFYKNGEINNQIIKHSKDIIDLIEVGDYVNGCKVYKSNNVDGLFTNDNGWIMIIERINIKSILTHEQLEANAYKIEKEKII